MKRSIVLLASFALVLALALAFAGRMGQGSQRTHDQALIDPKLNTAGDANIAGSRSSAKDIDSGKELTRLLRELSNLANSIDKQQIRLQDARTLKQEPDATMWELRQLIHRYPSLQSRYLAFLRDQSEPLGARIFASFAISQPSSQDLVDLLSIALKPPSSVNIANSLGIGLYTSRLHGIGRAWNTMFEHLQSLGLPDSYAITSGLEFVPEDVDENRGMFFPSFQGLNYSGVLDSIVSLLEVRNEGLFQVHFMRVAWAISDSPIMSKWDMAGLRRVIERSYLESDAAWLPALDMLTDASRGWSSSDIDTLGRGLTRFDSQRTMSVLNEVAGLHPTLLRQEPFVSQIDNVLTWFSKSPKDGGPKEGTCGHLCWSLMVDSASAWVKESIVDNHSSVLRLRFAQALEAYALGADTSEAYERRAYTYAQMFLRDREFGVRLCAAFALLGALERRRPPLEASECASLRQQLSNWIQEERTRGNAAPRLKELSERLMK